MAMQVSSRLDREQAPAWLAANGARLATLDVDAPLDDLEPLRAIIGDARVVALGEGAHFVREYWQLRQRVLRFLVERCGFSLLALEHGFAEGIALDRWLRGEGHDDALALASPAAHAWGARDTMHWLRAYNARTAAEVGFVGIDIPEAGGTLVPALAPVAAYLRAVDPDALALVEAVLAIAERIAAGSAARAAPAWAALDVATQDALTAGLARLEARFTAVEVLYVARSDRHAFDVARRQLAAATCADHMLRAMSGLMAGAGLPADVSARETFMAGSVLWALERSPGARVLVVAHNNHVQKAPVAYGGRVVALPMGQHLADRLGAAYVAIGATSAAAHGVDMRLDDAAAAGFTVVDVDLGSPAAGSLEDAVVRAGLDDAIVIADLRAAPRTDDGPAIDRVRSQAAYVDVPLPAAFDAVIAIPTLTRDPDLGV